MKQSKKNKQVHDSRSLRKIFVYGTLRENYGHKLYKLLTNNFELVGKGAIKGNLFDIGKYPGAVLSKTGNKIIGEIYSAKNKGPIEPALEILDRYEGYDKSNLDASEYIRKGKLVKLSNGKKVFSWVYEYNKPVRNKQLIESGDYIRHISGKKQGHSGK